LKKNILFSVIVTITISFTQYGNEGSRDHCSNEPFCLEDSTSFLCAEFCPDISLRIIQSCSPTQSQFYSTVSSADESVLGPCFTQYINTNTIPNSCSIYEQVPMNDTISYEMLLDENWWNNGNGDLNEHVNYANGWGVFLKNDSLENTNLAIHVNHPLTDENTDFIGGLLFENLSSGYLLISGAHRYSFVDESDPTCSTGDTCQTNYGADTARREDECNNNENNEYTTSFQLFHESLSTNINDLVSVSIHGFINDALNIVNPPAFILSNGNDISNHCIPPDLFTSTIYHKLIDSFSGDSLFSDYCGSESVAIGSERVAIIVQQEIDCINQPTTCGDELTSPYSEYGAYSNPQGRYTNNTDTINSHTEGDVWIHIEMDECIRDNYDLYSRTAEVIAQAITYCNSGGCNGCDANNPCSIDGVNYDDYYYDCTCIDFYEDGTKCLRGDNNNDGTIDVLDIALMVNLILEQEFLPIADMNEDGTVNILDIVLIVNIIMEN